MTYLPFWRWKPFVARVERQRRKRSKQISLTCQGRRNWKWVFDNNNNKCISSVPYPSVTIYVWGSKCYTWNSTTRHNLGAGIAQWLEHRTRDWKVAGSNPCWNGGRIFFSRVDFLCWLLFRYPFHPRVTTVARKKSRSFCQKCRWQVTAKHTYTLRMWILLNRASALVTTCP